MTKKPRPLIRRPWPEGLRSLTADPSGLTIPEDKKRAPGRMGLCWRMGERILAAGSLGYSRSVEAWTVLVWYPQLGVDAFARDMAGPGHVAKYASDYAAIRAVVRQIPGEDFFPVRALFMEEGRGNSRKSVRDQARCRGLIEAASYEAGNEWALTLTTSQWWQAAGQHFGVKFGRTSDKAKMMGLTLARDRLGFGLSKEDLDVSDAIMQSEAVAYLDLLPTEGT